MDMLNTRVHLIRFIYSLQISGLGFSVQIFGIFDSDVSVVDV